MLESTSVDRSKESPFIDPHLTDLVEALYKSKKFLTV